MKITQWRQMVTRLKGKFISGEYELELFKKLQNLKEDDMSVKEDTKEFYKVIIRSGHQEMDRQKVARYINGL